jgi:hypothetical protein
MKAFLPCLLGLALLGGCSAPKATSQPEVKIDMTGCREKIPEALGFASMPGQTRRFLTEMGTKSGIRLQPYLDRYYQVLGYNLSSIALMVDRETAERTSLNLAENLDPGLKAAWLRQRIREGKSLYTERDIRNIVEDGDFIRLDLDPRLPISGSLYIYCGVIEGRTIGQQTFVDFYNRRGEARKVSLVALAGWIESKD